MLCTISCRNKGQECPVLHHQQHQVYSRAGSTPPPHRYPSYNITPCSLILLLHHPRSPILLSSAPPLPYSYNTSPPSLLLPRPTPLPYSSCTTSPSLLLLQHHPVSPISPTPTTPIPLPYSSYNTNTNPSPLPLQHHPFTPRPPTTPPLSVLLLSHTTYLSTADLAPPPLRHTPPHVPWHP
jgi:hypothetical protein